MGGDFFIIADSAQFSALVTESVPAAHAVGTALTIQTSFGFLLTMVSIQLVPPVVAVVGWKCGYFRFSRSDRRSVSLRFAGSLLGDAR